MNSNVKLQFSADTITFDTVFASVGSITKTLTIYNNNNFDVSSNIKLKGLSAANFRMNIDGTPGNIQNNILIPKNDSIFIFIEVTINPSLNTTPYILSDSLIFESGNSTQSVMLVAWGQDAVFHTPNTFGEIVDGLDTTKIYYHQIASNQTWTNNKPHVIYGYVIVEPNAQLNIDAGTNIYFHQNSGILVGNPFSNQAGGTLKVNGTYGNEVTFQGDRLDSWYTNLPGQWDRIRFIPGSVDNEINYAIIKNGTTGIHADTVANNNPTVKINNTIISNMSSIGILGQGAKIMLKTLDSGRLTIAAMALGLAQGAYEAALKYAQKREQFGKPIVNFQAIAFKLADMETKIEAARALLYQACWLKDNGYEFGKQSAMAKLYCSEIAREVAERPGIIEKSMASSAQ